MITHLSTWYLRSHVDHHGKLLEDRWTCRACFDITCVSAGPTFYRKSIAFLFIEGLPRHQGLNKIGKLVDAERFAKSCRYHRAVGSSIATYNISNGPKIRGMISLSFVGIRDGIHFSFWNPAWPQ